MSRETHDFVTKTYPHIHHVPKRQLLDITLQRMPTIMYYFCPPMSTKHLYLQEWIWRKGSSQEQVAGLAGITVTQVSRLCNNKFKGSPRRSTLEAIQIALGLDSVEDLWTDPFSASPEARSGPPMMDLEKWLDAEEQLIKQGQPAPPWLVEMIRALVEQQKNDKV